MLDALTLKPIEDAWEFGLTRKQFLDAVDGDAYEFVVHEVLKASAQASRTRKGSSSAPHNLA